MRVRCVAHYRNEPRGLDYHDGQVFDAEPAMVAWLMADAPDCFVVGVADQKQARPAEDKAVKAAANKGL